MSTRTNKSKKAAKQKRQGTPARAAAAVAFDEAVTPLIEVTPSAEGFIAAADSPDLATSSADDMAEYLGEIFVDGSAAGNDVALDMETLQPLGTAAVHRPPTVAMGPAVSEGQVRELLTDFEDAPTLPEAPRYRTPDLPDVHVAARFADSDGVQRPRFRFSGR